MKAVTPLTIMIADANPIYRNMMARIASRLGHTPIVCATFADIKDKWQIMEPDVLISSARVGSDRDMTQLLYLFGNKPVVILQGKGERDLEKNLEDQIIVLKKNVGAHSIFEKACEMVRDARSAFIPKPGPLAANE